MLIEPGEEAGNADARLDEIEAALGDNTVPRLLHGYDESAWRMVTAAAQRGYDTRTGFEDTLLLPDGTFAESNEELIVAAVSVIQAHRSVR